MKEIKIEVYNVVGSEYCIESDDGEKVFSMIKNALENNKKVILSFRNIKILTTAFLNSAIGQLYGYFNENVVDDNLITIEIKEMDKIKLKKVMETAKIFYKNPNLIKESIEEILGE